MTSTAPIDVILEESTIDPRTPLPSFLEMKLLEATVQSAQKVLKSSIEAIATHASQYRQSRGANGNSSLRQYINDKIAFATLQICRGYSLELEMLITYIIERNVLVSSHAAISEQLFGFKRSNISRQNRVKPLRHNDAIKAALLLAVGPYMSEKIRRCYEIQRDRRPNLRNTPGIHQSQNQRFQRSIFLLEKVRSWFTYFYPFLHMSNEAIHIAYNFAYMIGKSVYYNPSQHLLGQIIRRLTIADNMKQKPTTEKSSMPKSALKSVRGPVSVGLALAFCLGWIGQFRRELRRRRRRIIAREDSIINNSMQSNAGGLNNVGNENRGISGNNTPNIPPPLPPAVNVQDGVRTPSNPSLCPLCNQQRINPVASTSGFVFCYRCIALYIRENLEKCPVTGMKCKESELIRIYESTNVVNRS